MDKLETLKMAFLGHKLRAEALREEIDRIEGTPAPAQNGRARRQLSAAARARIGRAQRKRWAAYHKRQKAGR